MERRLYCIYDLLAEAPVNNIFMALGTDEEAKRMFRQVLSSPDSECAKNPGDYGLCYVGLVNYADLIVSNSVLPGRPILLGTDVVREFERARAGTDKQVDGPVAVVK